MKTIRPTLTDEQLDLILSVEEVLRSDLEKVVIQAKEANRLRAPRTEADASQGAMAIALIALLGECAPIRRWKEFEDRGEERIPCFIQVETAQAIAEFFPETSVNKQQDK